MEKYKTWDDVPENLATKTQLGKMGLKPAKDQKPVAVRTSPLRYIPDRDLYEIALAVPKRKMTEAQAAALEAARRKAMTTTCCNRYVGTVNWREKGDMCPDCYAAWQEDQHEAFLKEAKQEAAEWARGVLADPAAVILDTETTGLEGRIVDIAIIKTDGTVILNTLIDPECPIPAGASNIHGITDEMVKDAAVFDTVYYSIKDAVESASRVIIYNADFDEGRLWDDAGRCGLPILKFKAECAMLQYAAYYGEWSHYHKSFRWQRLNGGHRALGDCVASLELIKRMAAVTNEPE